MESNSPSISAARKAKGHTQQTLAEAIGVSRAAVANWEANLAQPDVTNAKALGAVLGLSLDQIYDAQPKKAA